MSKKVKPVQISIKEDMNEHECRSCLYIGKVVQLRRSFNDTKVCAQNPLTSLKTWSPV